METLQGQFLIAASRLRDSNFYKTVVLLVEHNSHGAMGLVVNRPSSVRVDHALCDHFGSLEIEDHVHVGGPVEPNALFILHNVCDYAPTEGSVVPGVYLGASEEAFENVVRNAASGDPCTSFRIFCGCAGWGPGQLESELANGDWLLLPASREFVFQHDPYDLYDAVLQTVYARNRILPHDCKNPSLN